MEKEIIDAPAVIVDDFSFSYSLPGRHNSSGIAYKNVLKNISFTLNGGEKVSIIGPNGAGKSTLLLNIAGLMDEYFKENLNNTGSIHIYGSELNSGNIYGIREKIGFVFQNPDDQLFSTSVFEDVSFGLVNFLLKRKDAKARDRDYIKKMVALTLDKVNLAGKEDEFPHLLSYGEKKLASLATVLSYDPDILILDEPSGNLDPGNRDNFIKLIKSLDKTMIITTHDMDLAYEFSDRCIILNKGRIVFDGAAKDILRNKAFLQENELDIPLMFKACGPA